MDDRRWERDFSPEEKTWLKLCFKGPLIVASPKEVSPFEHYCDKKILSVYHDYGIRLSEIRRHFQAYHLEVIDGELMFAERSVQDQA